MELTVDYDDDAYKYPLNVTLDLDYNNVKIKFTIGELYLYNIDTLKDIRKCMEYGGKSESIGGGGNSDWTLKCDNNLLILDYIISGSGDDSSLCIKIPSIEFIPLFDKLIKLRECMSKNIKYEY